MKNRRTKLVTTRAERTKKNSIRNPKRNNTQPVDIATTKKGWKITCLNMETYLS